MHFLLKKIANLHKLKLLTNLFNLINLGFLLSLPIVLSKLNYYNPATGQLCLMLVCIVFLKLFSYAHFWDDVRKFIYKMNKINGNKDSKNTEISKLDNSINSTDKLKASMYEEMDLIIKNYPKNVSFFALFEFIFMPVLCFQYKFPRTTRIRISYLLNYGIKIIICSGLQYFIIVQWIMPIAKVAVWNFNEENYLVSFEKLVKIAIPNLYLWLLMFYTLFHCMLNFSAEITKFGDRQFYKDWWNSSFIDEYWRTWNLPTHFWLMRHIYNPIRRKKIPKFIAGLVVWIVSAIFHEYIISGALAKIHYSAFFAMMANFPVQIFQELLKNFKLVSDRSTILNVFFWISFCFLGQPLCILLYCYSYYSDHPDQLNKPY